MPAGRAPGRLRPMKHSHERGAVVITGTSTGIGAAAAVHLAGQGFHVFAGVRRPEDGDALLTPTAGGLTPIRIDITDEESIAAAADAVEDAVGEEGLAGLV